MSSARNVAGLLAVLLVAAGLRFTGIDFLLPLIVEPDPHIPVQVGLIESDDPDPNRVADWAKYPLIPAYLTAACSDPAALPPLDASIEGHLAAASNPVLRVRWTIAWMSLLLVPATFLVGRRFVSDGWALGAALLAATSHLAIHFGCQARPHGGAAPWPALTVWACILLAERATAARYLLVAVCGGIAVGTLQSSLALGFPVLAAHGLAGRLRSKRHLWLLVPLLGLALAIRLAYPFFFDAPPVEVQGKQVQQGGHKIMLALLNGEGFGVLGWSLWSWEPALAIGSAMGALAGMAALLRRRLAPRGWRPLLVVLAYCVPYGLVLGLYERSYERFLLPLIPFLAVWSMWACARLGRRGPRLAQAWALLLIACSSLVAVRLAQLRLAPNTVELASAWVAGNVAPDLAPGSASGADLETTDHTVWISRPNVLSIYKTPASDAFDESYRAMRGKRRFNWNAYQLDVLDQSRPGPAWDVRFMPLRGAAEIEQMYRDPTGYLLRLGERGHVVNEVYGEGRVHVSLWTRTTTLRALFPLRARFQPDHGDANIPHPLAYQEETKVNLYHRALRVLRGQAFGPVLEVFELDRLAE